MTDVDSAVVPKGLDTIKKNLQKFYVDKDKLSQADADAVTGRVFAAK